MVWCVFFVGVVSYADLRVVVNSVSIGTFFFVCNGGVLFWLCSLLCGVGCNTPPSCQLN